MVRTKKIRSIEADTSLPPALVAECVVDEAQRILGPATRIVNRADAERYLSERAEACYQKQGDFAKRIRSRANQGNAGRDWLYSFMRHWVSGWIHREMPAAFSRIPDDFRRGIEIPSSETAHLWAGKPQAEVRRYNLGEES